MMKKIVCFFCLFLLAGCTFQKQVKKIEDLSAKTVEEIKTYAKENNIPLTINYEYSETIEKDQFIKQSIMPDTPIEGQTLEVTFSLGTLKEAYRDNQVNEVGRVPIMMYHGIEDKKDEDTPYIGGNVDQDGYHRTVESFRKDLEFYYQNGYRMIALKDYIEGNIDVPLGKSPIVLTFDDGLKNQITVNGVDENGNLQIDPNCAVGVLEEFKKKYPDYQVTATFFVNGGLFRQPEYNSQILHWLIENGYDVGNHSYTHANFKELSYEQAVEEIGKTYALLKQEIAGQYVPIVALPYGSPGKKTHETFPAILKGVYNGEQYETLSTLQVGWESDYSPFSISFDSQFIKRIRAYDNNGTNFDIAYNFKKLEQNRYISDGDISTIVVPSAVENTVNPNTTKKIITY